MITDTNEQKIESLLWDSFLGGDYSALGKLYSSSYDLLFNYGMKIYSDEELIKDTIQDLFVKLYNSNSLKPTEYVKAYLLHALRNLLYDKMASIKRHVNLDEHSFDLEIDDSELEKLFQQNDHDLERGRSLVSAYNKLPANQKQLIYLRFVKGFSYKEISEILDIKVQSAMNLLQRSLSNIRKLI